MAIKKVDIYSNNVDELEKIVSSKEKDKFNDLTNEILKNGLNIRNLSKENIILLINLLNLGDKLGKPINDMLKDKLKELNKEILETI